MAPRKDKLTSTKGQLRDIIYSAYQFYLKEQATFKHTEVINEHIKNVEERTAKATGVSINYLRNIIKEKQNPNTNENTIKYTKNFEYFNKIREIIHTNILKVQGNFSISQLKTNLELSGFQFNKKFIKTTLKKMGYEILKVNENKRLLVEKTRVRLQRIKYIKEIQHSRNAGRNIVYVGDNFVCTFPQNSSANEIQSKSISLTHACLNNAFLPGALMLNKTIEPSFDSHMFSFWVQNQLIPSLPPKSIVVLENEKLHNEMLNRPPHAYSRKFDMISWLQKHEIPFNPKDIKVELYFLIKKNKNKALYRLDEKLKIYGHTVLRLPKFHSDLNPINAIWSEVRNYLTTNYVANMTSDKIETLITEKLNEIGTENWKKAFEDVIDNETKYMEFEHQFDDFTDNLINNNNIKETSLSDTESGESEIDYSDSDSD